MLRVKKIHFKRHNLSPTVQDRLQPFGKPIIDGVSLNLKNGSFLGIVGPSGAGKSTLLKIIAGLLDADSGSVSLDSESISGPKDRLIPGHPEIKLVDQQFELDRFHTVEENLRLQMTHLPENLRAELTDELLSLMELGDLKKRKASELSGGEQQRLALARALACEPKVLLLDEPFAHLDAPIKSKVIRYLAALRKTRKTSFVLVSHDGREVLSLADEIAYFNEGKIQRTASPKAFYSESFSADEARFFGEINSLRIGRKTYLFRPDAYFVSEFENSIKVELSYRKTYYYGLFELDEYLYKNQLLLLKRETCVKGKNQDFLTYIYIENRPI